MSDVEAVAQDLYPPRDGTYPGVDRNAEARAAFLRGVEWRDDHPLDQSS